MAFSMGNISTPSISVNIALPPNYAYDAMRYNMVKYALKPYLKFIPPKLKIPPPPVIPTFSAPALPAVAAGVVKGGFAMGGITLPKLSITIPKIPAFPIIFVYNILAKVVKKIKLLDFISDLIKGKLPKDPPVPKIAVPSIPAVPSAGEVVCGFVRGNIKLPAIPSIPMPNIPQFQFQKMLFNVIKMGTKSLVVNPLPHFKIPAPPPKIKISVGG